ncbi:PRD domain-containing protein [Enterococcus sp. 5H]|uniref:PRD domain-containing protein n=1 Tax=Enterococcus sp. 5H TaxID=1229490 RepID=UPI0023026640|nr:PRD domain-containing protein [Enterococcus sp. 5H]MDA9471897.1 Beta-glucoside bgl operon antiterminator, BglG family [Enterococcus sp. 5H]
MYRIVQVLNNNVAIIRTQADQQAIAMGKGIVFQKKKGDMISADEVTNLFVLKNKESQENFSVLLKDVPLDFIKTAYEIIENAINNYNYPVQEYIYVTLTDHIFWSYERLKKNEYQKSQLPETKDQYPTEYQIAQDALRIIKERLDIDFPTEESKNISLHFINAKGKTEHATDDKTIDKKRTTLDLIESELRKRNISRNADNQNFYDRMMIHLRYVLERTSQETENDPFAEKMAFELKKDYPAAFQISEEIYQIIHDSMGIQLNTHEKVYFTIHIQRLM